MSTDLKHSLIAGAVIAIVTAVLTIGGNYFLYEVKIQKDFESWANEFKYRERRSDYKELQQDFKELSKSFESLLVYQVSMHKYDIERAMYDVLVDLKYASRSTRDAAVQHLYEQREMLIPQLRERHIAFENIITHIRTTHAANISQLISSFELKVKQYRSNEVDITKIVRESIQRYNSTNYHPQLVMNHIERDLYPLISMTALKAEFDKMFTECNRLLDQQFSDVVVDYNSK